MDLEEAKALYNSGSDAAHILNEISADVRSLGLERTMQTLESPVLVVVGEQSVGKSSFIWRLTKLEVPRSNGTCTRNPFEIRCKRGRKERFVVKVRREFDDFGKRYNEINDIVVGDFTSRAEFTSMCNRAVEKVMGGKDGFDLNCVVIEAFGPNMIPVNVVDLPGWVELKGGDDGFKQAQMCQQIYEVYLNMSNAIFILLHSAMENVEKDAIWARLKLVDPTLDRTIGILTKPDLVPVGEHVEAMKILTSEGELYDLRPQKGLFIVANPTTEELSSGAYEKFPERFDSREKSIYESPHYSDYFTKYKANFGFQNAKVAIVEANTSMIAERLPQWRSALAEALNGLQREFDEITPEGEADLTAQDRVSEAINRLNEKIGDAIRASSTGVSSRYSQNTKLWNMLKKGVLDPMEELISETTPVFCVHKLRSQAPEYGLDDLLELLAMADGPEFGVQYSTRAVLEVNSRTMNIREDKIQKLVTKAVGLIVACVSEMIEDTLGEFPQLKNVCCDCLVKVLHERERTVHKRVYDTVSHYHKSVPARRNQVVDHYECFQTLLFRNTPSPAGWKEDFPSSAASPDPTKIDRLYTKRNSTVRRPAPRPNEDGRPSGLSIFVQKFKKELTEVMEGLAKKRLKRVAAEDIYDEGANLWREDECHEIYFRIHQLCSRMKLDEERNVDLEELRKKLSIVLDNHVDDLPEINIGSPPPTGDQPRKNTKPLPPPRKEPLLDGWQELIDQTGKPYYWNKASNETTYERPVKSKDPNKRKTGGFKLGKQTQAAPDQKTNINVTTQKQNFGTFAPGQGQATRGRANMQTSEVKTNLGKKTRRRTRAFPSSEMLDVDRIQHERERDEFAGDQDLLKLDVALKRDLPTLQIRVIETRLGLPCYFMPLVTVQAPSMAIPEGFAKFFKPTATSFKQVHFPLLDDSVLWQRRLGSFMAFSGAYLWDRDNGMIHELVNVMLEQLMYKLQSTFQRAVEKNIKLHSLTEERAASLLCENKRILMRRKLLNDKIGTIRSCIERINSFD